MHSLGQRSFSYAVLSVWNSLPYKVRSPNTRMSFTFQTAPKLHLFKLSVCAFMQLHACLCPACVRTCTSVSCVCTYMHVCVLRVYVHARLCPACVRTCMSVSCVCTYMHVCVLRVYVHACLCPACVRTCMSVSCVCMYMHVCVLRVYVHACLCPACVRTCMSVSCVCMSIHVCVCVCVCVCTHAHVFVLISVLLLCNRLCAPIRRNSTSNSAFLLLAWCTSTQS